jgi:TDG/mug DNA glycosylase family protein
MTGDAVELATQTLPDLLRDGLDIVFVGINPSVFSVQRGHYFARKTNRFWPCLSRSVLSRRARAALSVEQLGPEHDVAMLDHGIGFTDLVKRATPKASDLAPSEFTAGVQHLQAKLDRYRPRIACFHGVTGYRHVHRLLTEATTEPRLGLQDIRMEATRVYLVPNPSGANAHFTREDQIGWYDRLAECLEKPTGMSAQR